MLTCMLLQSDGKQSDRVLQEELNRLRAEQQSKKNLRDDRQRQLVCMTLLLGRSKLIDIRVVAQTDTKAQRRSAQNEVASYNTIDYDVVRLEKDIKDLGDKIDIAALEIEEARFKDKFTDLGIEILKLEAQREQVATELNGMQKHAETRAALNAAKSNLARVESRIEAKYVNFSG